MPVSKPFRIATDGKTLDGRNITRQQIQQMASSYNPEVYQANLWLDHIRSFSPDGQFKSHGHVVSLTAKEVSKGDLKGKIGLYAVVDAHQDLVDYHSKGQKTHHSIELHPEFPTTGGAYLYGLAPTDEPASLGTEVMKFTKEQNKDLVFSNAEKVDIEYLPEGGGSDASEKDDGNKPSLFSRISNMFKKHEGDSNERFEDNEKSIELIAKELDETKSQFTTAIKALETKVEEVEALETEVAELKTFKSKIENHSTNKPVPKAKGGGDDNGDDTAKKGFF